MTKKRKEKKDDHGVKGKLNLHGGGNKFAIFEFDEDDETVENNSRKYDAKFAPKKTLDKPPLDKFSFLETFMRGDASRLNSPGNETSISDVREISGLDSGRKESPGSMLKSLSLSTNRCVIECSSPRRDLRISKVRKAGGRKMEKKRKPVYNLDSDEEDIVEMQTSASYDLAKERGSRYEGVSSQCDSDGMDCEVEVVSPIYVKVGNVAYINCSLTFSSSFIRLKGCLYGKEEPHSLDWSTSHIDKIKHQLRESDETEVVTLLLRTWDADEDETCKTSSGTLEVEFAVVKEIQWCKTQDKIRSLNTKYESAWETIISECSFNEHFDDIVYPEGDPDGIFISRGDVDRLKPVTFLNDTIIDFYIKYLLNKTKPEEKRRFHFFNTFFFRKLAPDMDKVFSGTWDAREAFQRVRKWTRNIDLFDKDYIFIPVNFSFHWSLIVICHHGELANIKDNDFADSYMRPCILHMDSISGSHRGLENLIRSYLWEEWQERYDKQDADIHAKFSCLNFEALQLPQQENSSDCGLFLLHYAELFLAQAANFSTGKYTDVLNKEWFLPAEVSSKKRYDIRKLISKLASDNAGKERHGSCADKNISINEGDRSLEIVNRSDEKTTSDENSYQLVNGKSLQQLVLLVPTSPSSCMRLPKENSLAGDIRCINEADEDNKSIQVHFTPCSFKVGEIEVPLDVTEISSGFPGGVTNVNSGEQPVYEVASTPEKKLHFSESSHNIVYIVEDSEEEEWGAGSGRLNMISTLRGVC